VESHEEQRLFVVSVGDRSPAEFEDLYVAQEV
jgi:hypothetical protein